MYSYGLAVQRSSPCWELFTLPGWDLYCLHNPNQPPQAIYLLLIALNHDNLGQFPVQFVMCSVHCTVCSVIYAICYTHKLQFKVFRLLYAVSIACRVVCSVLFAWHRV